MNNSIMYRVINNSFKSFRLESIVLICSILTSHVFADKLTALPWIGDGRPVLDGAEWYGVDCAPEFKAEFVLPEGAREAKMHFACAGFGWVGIGEGGKCALMDPSGLQTLWSVYDKTVYAHALAPLKVLDKQQCVGAELALAAYPATNVVYVRLGNGFYNMPPLRFWGSKCFRDKLSHGRACFKLAIDGVEKPLEWKWRKTNIMKNCVYLGTEVDASISIDAEWRSAVKVDGPKGTIIPWPHTNPQTIARESQEGSSRWIKEGEVQVVDFGDNTSSVPVFEFCNEKKGTQIEIVYGERLNSDGTVNVLTQTAGQIKRPGMGGPGAPAIGAQRDVYICRGTQGALESKGEIFQPPFTWHIFRYAEIRGAKNLLRAGKAKRRVYSMLPEESLKAEELSTASSEIKAIHEMCVRTFRANLLGGVQSDCPGRERLGYGGDLIAVCEAYMLNFDMREIYLKILRDFANEAEDDGWITETAPYVGIADAGFGGRSGPMSWALAVPELIDALLRHYNDLRALDFYPICSRYVRLVDAKCPSGLLSQCLGDHEALERAPREVVATAHWYRFVKLTAKFARRLDKVDDAQQFEAIAEKVRAAFAAKYVKNGVVANGTQSAQAIGLYLGLVPQDQREAALANLVKAIEIKGYAPFTGIFSTRYMLMYLSENARVDIARKIVLHKGFPGWLYMLERGATTLWETWRESDNIYSNCHPMFGSVDEWILKYGLKER